MIYGHIQNSSTMSTEDGSGSTVYGGPQPTHATAHRHAPSYTRRPLPDYFSHDAVQSENNASTAHGRVSGAAATFSGRPLDAVEGNSTQRRSTSPRWGEGGGVAPPSSSVRDGSRPSPPLAMRAPYTDAAALQPPTASSDPSMRAPTDPSQPLLEVVVPVLTALQHGGEAQQRLLGLYIRTGRGGPNNVTRLVLVRLTDPSDPFFLYELELLEDDYGAFKHRLELLVDFNGFPRYLVNLLRDIAEGASPYELSFALHAADTSRGTLRVLEATAFKTVEHISLLLLRQGDAGLKKYLAERFQFFERSFRCNEAASAATARQLQAEVEDLRSANAELQDALRRKEEEMRFSATDAEKTELASLNRLREQHNKETHALRESYEKKLETHTRALEEKTQQLRDTTSEKDTEITAQRTRVEELEATTASLESRLRSTQDTCGLQAKELETLREMNDELASFKAEATKAMSENELNYVMLTERLRGTSTALQSREEKIAALVAHNEKQDAYIRILAERSTQQGSRVREIEKSLEKAHHIIANQLQTIKSARDRYHIAVDQLRSQEALLQEKEGALRRQKDEATSSNERVQELLKKNNELRDQLEKTNTAREQLVLEVKQTQQALLRLQQSTSVNGRHWGVLSGGYRTTSTSSPAALHPAAVVEEGNRFSAGLPADLMGAFSANTHVMGSARYRSGETITGSYRAAVPPTSAFAGAISGGDGVGSGGLSLFPSRAMPTSSASPSPALSSQERGGSSETAGLTDPQGRASSSSLGKTEPSPALPGHHHGTQGISPPARRTQPIRRSVPLDKPSPAAQPSGHSNAIRSSFNELALKSFSVSDAARPEVAVGAEAQSAYF